MEVDVFYVDIDFFEFFEEMIVFFKGVSEVFLSELFVDIFRNYFVFLVLVMEEEIEVVFDEIFYMWNNVFMGVFDE